MAIRSDLKPESPDLRPEGPDEGDEQTDGRMDRRTDERKSPCVLQDFVPFGAAAQKGGKKKHADGLIKDTIDMMHGAGKWHCA